MKLAPAVIGYKTMGTSSCHETPVQKGSTFHMFFFVCD